MTLTQAAAPSSKNVFIETANFYIRTLTVDDATERCAAWTDQAEVRHGLNLPDRKMTKADIETYIATFDQQSKVLFGIFDKTNNLLVGFLVGYIDWALRRYLANTVVGEAAYRHRGVLLEISRPYRAHFFETLDLRIMTATVLANNKAIIRYLDKTGWQLHDTLKNQAKSHADGTMVDVCLYTLTREAWHAWLKANPEG
jgi:RimJ/RimL family protein N-acetyltransferase